MPPFDEEQNKANIDAARNIDEILSGSIFAKLPPSSVRFKLELMTANDADIAAEQKVGEGNWERFLSQNMPRAAARGILDCALILVKEAVTVLPVTSSPSNVWAKEYSKHILNASHAKVDPAPEAD
ncbi:hypothetical protein EVJ58_g8735 [Rhodofomes roseus]|uniref:Uncharacterized protein n=1 Tax=Rhodofomes roseus TaxID=34475 RepID=A0A4Y9XYA9_9APHY|nr:hypothetical protein EVJ58_g8735 [Rhodofomes roseus]